MTILIVDDSKAMRTIVRRTLRQTGLDNMEVLEACNGREAWELLQSSTLDVVLCDWNMPEMSGLELLQKLTGSGSQVKLGFVTSESTAAMRAKAIEAGARFLITKPFTPDTFRQQLEPVLAI